MAGSVTIGKGASAGYYTDQCERGTDYYAAGAGGGKAGHEPAGRWTGDGLPDLGLERGGEVDREVFAEIFARHTDPRDGSKIGRTLAHKDAEAVYGGLLSAEPEATAERKAELWVQAQAQAEKGRPVPFFDATFSVSKSITLLHASARAMKLQAQESGDPDKAAQAQRLEDTVWDAINAGAEAGLAHLQAHAGFTRTGAGGIRQEDAHGWVVARFDQHTSRKGDPQLHAHQTILNKVRTERDGKVRTLDGRMLYQERGAAAAISTAVMENQLTRDLGLEWVNRDDGHGREIKGVPQSLMDEFSSRARQDIAPELMARVTAYREQYGHDPDELALWKMGQAVSREKREPKREEDQAQLVREWAHRAAVNAGTALEPLAAQVCGKAQAQAPDLSLEAERLILAQAVNGIQSRRSTFTISDLTRAVSEQLPAAMPVMDPAEAAAFLPRLAGRAAEAGMVVRLEAPALLTLPPELRRADGESVYSQHRAVRFSTDGQLMMEARVLEAAQGTGAPCAEPEAVAVLLGADLAALRAQLEPDAPADSDTVTGSGLHLDQAAAAFAVMTSDRRLDVIVGPAGTGKSRTIAAIADIWPQLHPGARVIALTETQQGANVLRAMGVTDAHNVSMFMTDPRLREVPAGSIVIADEASMVSMPHWDALTRLAADAGAKMLAAGDQAQHQAVTAGGGFGLFTRRLGSLQLGEALRFRQEWERQASLRLRAGDESVITRYDENGRIVGGSREEMLEEAYRRWLADYLDGQEPVLIARDNADCRELSRRARADLIRYGRVSGGPAAKIQDGAVASAGDRIMARQNTRGHAITNRDVYEVDEVRPDGSVIARLLTADGFAPATELPAAYLSGQCHLAYGRTSHDVQGSTFQGRGYALVKPADDREFLYTAMTRARSGNYAFAVTDEPVPDTGKPAAAPETGRARRLEAEQAGELIPVPDLRSGTRVFAEVMARHDPDLSATETLERAFSDQDSLAILSLQWTDLARAEFGKRYDRELHALLDAGTAAKVTADYRYTWLCRSLRAGEMAGMDGGQVLAEAISAGSLDGAENVAAVLDHRVRELIPATLPLDGGWLARAPLTDDPQLTGLLQEIGAAMDARTRRLGEHAADTMPLWAARNLGPVPDDPAAREHWLSRAGAVMASREMTGHDSPGDPIGPAPSASSPELRAAWHSALIALGKTDGMDMSSLSEAELEMRRGLYVKETAKAPVHVGRELRVSRQARDAAAVRHDRAVRDAELTADPVTRERHLELAGIWGGVRDRAGRAAGLYAEAQATREEWNLFADPTLRTAFAADLESRRRNPWARREPLKSGEPESGLIPGQAEPSDMEIMAALGLAPGAAEVSDHPQRMAARARQVQEHLDEITAMPQPSEDPDMAPSEPWKEAAARRREAVSQPPAVMVPPREAEQEREAV